MRKIEYEVGRALVGVGHTQIDFIMKTFWKRFLLELGLSDCELKKFYGVEIEVIDVRYAFYGKVELGRIYLVKTEIGSGETSLVVNQKVVEKGRVGTALIVYKAYLRLCNVKGKSNYIHHLIRQILEDPS